MKRKRKLTGLATVGLLSLSLGGTMVLAPNVTPTVTAQAATSLSEAKTKLDTLTDKAKVIINYKGVEEYDKQTMQADLELADDAIKSGDMNQMNQAIGIIAKDVGDFDSNGKRIQDVDSQPGFDDSADNAIRPGSTSDSSSDDSGYTTNEVEGGTDTDPIKDTQDRKQYEDYIDKENGVSTDDSSTPSSNSNESSVDSSSTDKTGSSSFSKQSVNAPGNAGSTTGTSSTSNSGASNIPSSTKTNSKKGNLPGTDEDKTQPVLIATIGLLGILGLGGTAFALWLRQRKHVNNE